jgi:hypothetical protein
MKLNEYAIGKHTLQVNDHGRAVHLSSGHWLNYNPENQTYESGYFFGSWCYVLRTGTSGGWAIVSKSNEHGNDTSTFASLPTALDALATRMSAMAGASEPHKHQPTHDDDVRRAVKEQGLSEQDAAAIIAVIHALIGARVAANRARFAELSCGHWVEADASKVGDKGRCRVCFANSTVVALR